MIFEYEVQRVALSLLGNSVPHLGHRDVGTVEVNSFDFLIFPSRELVLDGEHVTERTDWKTLEVRGRRLVATTLSIVLRCSPIPVLSELKAFPDFNYIVLRALGDHMPSWIGRKLCYPSGCNNGCCKLLASTLAN